jgi:fructose-bisphosphate aldolase, class II
MTARDWLQKAKQEKFAIGAFNVGNLETFKAIVQAAVNKKSPVIIESSPGETKWMDADNIVDIAKNYSEQYGVPILVNLDHSETLEDCMTGIEAGYDLIHCDASKLEYSENVELTKKVAELAHAKGLTCEGELDHIGGSSEIHSGSAGEEAGKIVKTDPARAAEFVKATGIDIFAAFVGNIHGLYEGGEKKLDVDLVKQIADATGAFLSLHGSSGIPETQVAEAIQNGIVKVNLNTEIRQAYKDSLEKVLKENPNEYAMYKAEGPVIDSIQRLVEHKIEIFGSGGKA